MFIIPNQVWLEILLAVACGALVGFERQVRGKPAGIRTSALVCLGSMLFVKLGVEVAGPGTDNTRVLGQIITGIGFLGAGVILSRGGLVVGVTSASAIWILAGVGAAIGFGRYREAVAFAIAAVAVLTGVDLMERTFTFLQRGVHKIKGSKDASRFDDDLKLKD